jgi:hypothetical protein
MVNHPNRSRAARMSREQERLIEDNFNNTMEAFELLDLIWAEFQSDPTSTQCFDARIVERVKWCVARRKNFEKRSVFGD